MNSNPLEILQRANAAVRSAVVRFQPERTRCSAFQAQDFSALRSELRCAADCLRELPAGAAGDPALGKQISEFRCNLKQLRLALPGFHTRLLAEHTRLSVVRTQVNAVDAWVQTHKQTL